LICPGEPPEEPPYKSDTDLYFDFLDMDNPFDFDAASYLPVIPQTQCTYEIHRTFNVPFLGVKNFDFAPCVPLQPLRTVLQWAFAVITAWTCFMIIFRSSF